MKRFFKRLFAPLRKKVKENKGFTLLEILVVLTIMGFLIAMVAPRLAGISGGAVDTVCDSNQSRMIQMVSAFYERAGKAPNKLTNIVVQDVTAGTYAIPTVSDGNEDNGPETLSDEFAERVAPEIHYLTAAEVDDLADMGIRRVFNLNSYDNSGIAAADQGTPMAEMPLAAGMGVMMSGIGAALGADFTAPAADITNYGEGDFLGRIVFGFGPENSIVTSGLVANAAHCPGGIQNADNVTYNDYNIVLPRLQGTVDRNAAPAIPDAATGISGSQYLAFGYTEDTASGTAATATVAANGTITGISAGFKARLFSFEAQEAYAYATMCPEGHMFPADDSDFWAVDVDGTLGITTP
ncbi:hypothetical protein JCM14469_25070 [Desulfatiferula olefinivorans]